MGPSLMHVATNRPEDLLLSHDIAEEEPSWEKLWDLLAAAMQGQDDGDLTARARSRSASRSPTA